MKACLKLWIIFGWPIILLCSCSGPNKSQLPPSSLEAAIFPDYTNLSIPPNVAPLNFSITTEGQRFVVDFIGENGYTFSISTQQKVVIPAAKWQKLLSENTGKSFTIQIYRKFQGSWEKLHPAVTSVSADSVDPYLTYRLVPPAYDIYRYLNIQQRHLESFDCSDIVNNSFSEGSCLNCHTPNQQNPDEFMVHFRAEHSGTLIYKDGQFRRLNTATPELKHTGVYPSWHPGGRFIAFAVVKPALYFHADAAQRTKVFDAGEATVALLDLETNTMLASPKLKVSDQSVQGTYPAWSSDGKWLYFCRSHAVPGFDTTQSENYLNLQFDLLRIAFDEKTRSFGSIETVLDAKRLDQSVSLPKISPDGRWMVFCMTRRGTNPTWRSDADLYLMNLETMAWKPLATVNSNDADSYVSWSSNSRWIVFSSKRNDGFVALPHFSHIDGNGNASKPFVLPQEDPEFYNSWLKSFNVPEFARGKVKPGLADFEKAVKGPIIDVKFAWTEDSR